jgi:hypothetical protein
VSTVCPFGRGACLQPGSLDRMTLRGRTKGALRN